MSQLRSTTPKVRFHSSRNVEVADYYDATGLRRMVTLGPPNSPEAKQALARLCAELAAGRPAVECDLTVSEVSVLFPRHALLYYRRPDGSNTSEIHGYKSVIRLMRETYGHTPASRFGIAALKAIRQRMVDAGWCRRTVNQATWRVKKIFKWAAGEGHLPPQVFQALQVVGGLQLGRSQVRESAPLTPVPHEVVKATLPHLTRPVAAMIRLQQVTGMRPGEVVRIRRCDIDTSRPEWKYMPRLNKMAHKSKSRVVFLGRIAQSILNEFPTLDSTEFVFASPRKPGCHYTVSGYGRAVRRACRKHRIEEWYPHQIRHTFATQVRKEFGLEHAQVVLDHAKADVTQIYAEKNHALVATVAAAIG